MSLLNDTLILTVLVFVTLRNVWYAKIFFHQYKLLDIVLRFICGNIKEILKFVGLK